MENKKLLSIMDLMQYLSMGRNNARIIGEAAGAVVHCGKKVLYRKAAIDAYVDGTDVLPSTNNYKKNS